MIWREFEVAAPELARAGRERFESTHVALLATLRRDGAPRISPIEPYVVLGHLLLGALRDSKKALDLVRQPTCALHSSVSDVDGSEGEFKLHGRAIVVEDAKILRGDYDAWWKTEPADRARVFSLDIDEAALVTWNTDASEMHVQYWSPGGPVRTERRTYP